MNYPSGFDVWPDEEKIPPSEPFRIFSDDNISIELTQIPLKKNRAHTLDGQHNPR